MVAAYLSACEILPFHAGKGHMTHVQWALVNLPPGGHILTLGIELGVNYTGDHRLYITVIISTTLCLHLVLVLTSSACACVCMCMTVCDDA